MFCENPKKPVIGNERKKIRGYLLEESARIQNPPRLIKRGSLLFSVKRATVTEILDMLIESGEIVFVKNTLTLILRADVLKKNPVKGVSV